MSIIVFDFDGVIVPESEEFKKRAWRALFSNSVEYAAFESAEAELGRGRGGDRFSILERTFELLGIGPDQRAAKVQQAAARFDELVQKMIADAGLPVEVRHLLSELATRGNTLYLNSATPAEALKRTIEALGIGNVFAAVLGRPNTKVENFTLIAKRESAAPETVVFVGDSPSDAAAANEFGCQFIAFLNEWSDWKPEESVRVARSHSELLTMLS